jgi:uncharacterized protein Usg
MERDDWTVPEELRLEPPCLTLAIIELALWDRHEPRQTFAWVGMDSAPHFPRLQRYMARLAMQQSGEIIRLHVESGSLPQAIDLRFDADRPTIH